MSTRRFNYTNCKRILRAHVRAALVREAETPGYRMDFDLSSYDLPPEAEVVAEAYANGWTVMRFGHGTIANPVQPQSRSLTAFDVPEGILFRLKVLGVGDQTGLILAEADRVQPVDLENTGDARSFILVRAGDLGDVLWMLDLDGPLPLLLVNDRIRDWRSFVRRPEVRALILPEIMRQVLWSAVVDEPDETDLASWQHQAISIARTLGMSDPPSATEEDALTDWVEAAVRNFAARHRLWNESSLLRQGDQ